MKKTLLICLSFILIVCSFSSCSDDEPKDNESSIEFNSLPSTAQEFIKKYFKNQNIVKIEKNEYASATIYSVYLDDVQIDFKEDGEWQQVDAHYGKTIPFTILPEPVQATLNERYPGFGVNQITREGQNFYVVLTNNQGGDSINLTFNQSGEIIDPTLT